MQCIKAKASLSILLEGAFSFLFFILKGEGTMSTVSDIFGSLVFDDRVMRATLSADIYASLRKTIDEGSELDSSVANAVAQAMKDCNY